MNAFCTIGNSRTAPGTFQTKLIANLAAIGGKWCETAPRIALGGWTTADAVAWENANLASTYGPSPSHILVNLGANDVLALPAEAVFKADYGELLDDLHTQWPGARIYCMRVWRRGEGADCDTLAGWIADVIGARGGWAFLGPDERVFLENGDDGATYTVDGVHPTDAGYALVAAQWQATMGY